MSTIRKYLAELGRIPAENVAARDRLVEYFNGVFQSRRPLTLPGDARAVTDFVCAEAERIKGLLPDTASYKAVEDLCSYANGLTELMMSVIGTTDRLSDAQNALMNDLWQVIDEKRSLEHAIDEMFDRSEETETVTEYDLSLVMDVLSPITDQYRRNNFALGMLHYADKLPRLTLDAEMRLQEYTAGEMIRLRYIGDGMTEDDANGLEYLADLCRYILNDRLTEILNVLPALGRPHIDYYVLSTLLSGKKPLPDGLVDELAHSDEYAALCKTALVNSGKEALFPAECDDAAALSKSALIHWLMYPTELGRKPDAVLPLCSVGLEDGSLYVFKFISDADTLPEDRRNRWLIGWSDGESETFSDYEPLDRIKANTPEKLRAYFRRKLG